jgi:PAS domain S-box-containing protein
MIRSKKQSPAALSPLRILLLVLLIVFAAEAAVMVVLPALLPADTDNRVRAIVDACLLTLAAAPVLWWVVIRPLRRFATTEQAKADSIVAAAVEGIITIDERGTVDSFNPAAEQIFGYRAEEIVGRDVEVLMPPDFVQRHREALRHYDKSRPSTNVGNTIEVPGKRKDGSHVPLELSVSEISLGSRRLFTGVFRDLTATKVRARQQQVMLEFGQRALVCTDLEQLLDEAARCVADTLDVEHSIVWEVAGDGKNMTARAGCGWQEGIVGQATLDLSTGSVGHRLLAEKPIVVEDFTLEEKYTSPPLLRDHNVRCGVSVVIRGGEHAYGVLGAYSRRPRVFLTDDIHFLQDIAIEITLAIERRRAELQERERETLRAEQMAAVAQMATGVAHEIRNPLTSIKMLIQAAGEAGAAGGLQRQDIEIIEGEIRRMERSLKSFLDYARPPKLERHEFDLRASVMRVFALVESRASQQQVELTTDASHEPVTVSADPDQIQQLLLNLVLNALDAMPGGGQVAVEIEAPSDGMLQLRMLDSGPGISPNVSARLFQPFVTSKEAGVGLGLVISRRIAEDHGGSLTAHNRPQGGACFVLQIPVPK